MISVFCFLPNLKTRKNSKYRLGSHKPTDKYPTQRCQPGALLHSAHVVNDNQADKVGSVVHPNIESILCDMSGGGGGATKCPPSEPVSR